MYVFDSIRESQRYKELKLLERAGEISNLELQPKFLLQDSFKKNGKTYRKIEYIADFSYCQRRQNHSRRCKRVAEKHKLFEKKYPDLELRIIK